MKSKSPSLTPDERAAMRERAQELKHATGTGDVLAKLAALPPPDRAIGERLHAILKAHAPSLEAKTWYGMPAYARNGEIICFFQPASKFKARYATLGFSDKARLDDGAMWPSAFALQSLGVAEERKIITLVKKALG